MNSPATDELLGNSPEFAALLRSLDVAAATDVTVMLQGESGVGKELLARRLHRHSARADAPFVAVNCAALPEALAESELFGHRKGAFTGAVADAPGLIESARGGLLFLDEVAEMSPSVQAKLLRFLESGEYQAVGDTRMRQADLRIVAATHADLQQRVADGQFRADLFYRLNVVPFQVPALRERRDDILLLLEAFTRRFAERYGLQPPRYAGSCLKWLENDYAWPGNVRELRNFSERMLVLFSGREVARDNLPGEMRTAAAGDGRFGFRLPSEGIRLDELEQDLLRQALRQTRGNQSRAARLLGLTRDAFLYRLKKYSILSS